MTKANSEGMQQHLDVIAAAVASGKHAVIVVDRAAWHIKAKLRVPANLSILPLPPYSPEFCQRFRQFQSKNCRLMCYSEKLFF